MFPEFHRNSSYLIKMHYSSQDLGIQHTFSRNLSHLRQMFVRRFFIWIKVSSYSRTGHSVPHSKLFLWLHTRFNILWIKAQHAFCLLTKSFITSTHQRLLVEQTITTARQTNLCVLTVPGSGQHLLNRHSTGKKSDGFSQNGRDVLSLLFMTPPLLLVHLSNLHWVVPWRARRHFFSHIRWPVWKVLIWTASDECVKPMVVTFVSRKQTGHENLI